MKYTHKQQQEALEKACGSCGLGTHITWVDYKKDLSTWSDKIMGRWFRKSMPYKASYMYCNTLDMNFFYDVDGNATFTYAGYCNTDDECNTLINAFSLANKVLKEMEKEIEKLN